MLPAGTQELQRWVAEQQDPTPQRDALMVRLRAEAAVGPTGLANDIRRRLELHKQKLAVYQAIETRDFAGVEEDGSRKQQLQHLVLNAGILQETHWIAFSEKALGILGSYG